MVLMEKEAKGVQEEVGRCDEAPWSLVVVLMEKEGKGAQEEVGRSCWTGGRWGRRGRRGGGGGGDRRGGRRRR